ncbi:MAG: hypothetical protein ACJAZ3_001432 [Sphingobacteriales bacterium]|jgi:hypothetical protein
MLNFSTLKLSNEKKNNMMRIILTLLMSICFVFMGCETLDLGQIQKEAGKYMNKTPSNDRIISGLKQALEIGSKNAGSNASKTDGYFKNQLLFIAFPPEAQVAADKLRQLGFSSLVDDFILSLNRGAEKAAAQAAPIFIDAVKGLTIQDGMNILKGADNAATNYLKSNTYTQLNAKFQPVIQNSLASVNATKYWTDIISTYNKLPGVNNINPNLDQYVTEKAIDGLFILVQQEEKNIRDNPAARVTEILQEVFGYAQTSN